jgi:hypothetical protein
MALIVTLNMSAKGQDCYAVCVYAFGGASNCEGDRGDNVYNGGGCDDLAVVIKVKITNCKLANNSHVEKREYVI